MHRNRKRQMTRVRCRERRSRKCCAQRSPRGVCARPAAAAAMCTSCRRASVAEGYINTSLLQAHEAYRVLNGQRKAADIGVNKYIIQSNTGDGNLCFIIMTRPIRSLLLRFDCTKTPKAHEYREFIRRNGVLQYIRQTYGGAIMRHGHHQGGSDDGLSCVFMPVLA